MCWSWSSAATPWHRAAGPLEHQAPAAPRCSEVSVVQTPKGPLGQILAPRPVTGLGKWPPTRSSVYLAGSVLRFCGTGVLGTEVPAPVGVASGLSPHWISKMPRGAKTNRDRLLSWEKRDLDMAPGPYRASSEGVWCGESLAQCREHFLPAELWSWNELPQRSELPVTGGEQAGAGYPRGVF